MNSVLVTGATGFLGRQLALRLAGDGVYVHVLYRSEDRLRGLQHKNIHPFGGNLSDADSLRRAMEGCRMVFHMAAFASTWVRDAKKFYDENVGGTENVLNAARELGVEKLVYTSTAGVLGPSSGELNTEEKSYSGKHFTHYDRSKALSEQKVMDAVAGGMHAVILNPTRIFGPGLLSRSNAVTKMIDNYQQGKWKYIPGNGRCIGNYVYVEDVVDCHLLAMENGGGGQRYIAGGENLSYNEFFNVLAEVTGVRHRMMHVPLSLMMMAAGGMLGFAWLTGQTPAIVPAFVRRYNHDWAVSSEKARLELGYNPMSFEEGVKKTVAWLQARKSGYRDREPQEQGHGDTVA